MKIDYDIELNILEDIHELDSNDFDCTRRE